MCFHTIKISLNKLFRLFFSHNKLFHYIQYFSRVDSKMRFEMFTRANVSCVLLNNIISVSFQVCYSSVQNSLQFLFTTVLLGQEI